MMAAKSALATYETTSGGIHIQSKQDECTASGLVHKRKRLDAPVPTEHSNSNGRAPDVKVLTDPAC